MSSTALHPELRLMCVLAHPDDESLATGGTLARYAAEGVATYLVTATRGERGRFYDQDRPAAEIVARIRESELLAAATELGLREVRFLDYPDGALEGVDPVEAIGRIAGHLRRVRPQVVVTFGPDGAYGHPDHIAISQLTMAAVVCAADPSMPVAPAVPASHRVAKLYYIAWTAEKWAAYETALRRLVFNIDGIERQATPWPTWAVTTVIDTRAVLPAVCRAVSCHRTQMAIFSKLDQVPAEHQQALWGTQQFYRVFSTVNGGRATESDLFEGLRS
jgi:LmbE family N-acetylglucosaminyl deacetylase